MLVRSGRFRVRDTSAETCQQLSRSTSVVALQAPCTYPKAKYQQAKEGWSCAERCIVPETIFALQIFSPDFSFLRWVPLYPNEFRFLFLFFYRTHLLTFVRVSQLTLTSGWATRPTWAGSPPCPPPPSPQSTSRARAPPQS